MNKYIIWIAGKISTWKTYMLDKFKNLAEYNNIEILFLNVDLIRRSILYYSCKKTDVEYRKYLIDLLWIDKYWEKYSINGIDLQNSVFNNPIKYSIYKKEISKKIWFEILKQIENHEIVIIERAMLLEDDFLNLEFDYIIYLHALDEIIKKRLKWWDFTESEIDERLNNFYNIKKVNSLLDKKYFDNYIIIDTNIYKDNTYYTDLFYKVINKNE